MGNQITLNGWRIAWVVVLAFLAAGCSSVRPTDVHTDFPKEKAQIERRLHEVLVAAEQKDFARLESYHLYGPKFTKFTGSSPARLDAAATRKGEHDGLAPLQGLKMRADTLQVDVFGTVGIATFILDSTFNLGGETVRTKYRSTLVFVNENGNWKIVHEHLSPVTLPEPGGAANASPPVRVETNSPSSTTGSRR